MLAAIFAPGRVAAIAWSLYCDPSPNKAQKEALWRSVKARDGLLDAAAVVQLALVLISPEGPNLLRRLNEHVTNLALEGGGPCRLVPWGGPTSSEAGVLSDPDDLLHSVLPPELLVLVLESCSLASLLSYKRCSRVSLQFSDALSCRTAVWRRHLPISSPTSGVFCDYQARLRLMAQRGLLSSPSKIPSTRQQPVRTLIARAVRPALRSLPHTTVLLPFKTLGCVATAWARCLLWLDAVALPQTGDAFCHFDSWGRACSSCRGTRAVFKRIATVAARDQATFRRLHQSPPASMEATRLLVAGFWQLAWTGASRFFLRAVFAAGGCGTLGFRRPLATVVRPGTRVVAPPYTLGVCAVQVATVPPLAVALMDLAAAPILWALRARQLPATRFALSLGAALTTMRDGSTGVAAAAGETASSWLGLVARTVPAALLTSVALNSIFGAMNARHRRYCAGWRFYQPMACLSLLLATMNDALVAWWRWLKSPVEALWSCWLQWRHRSHCIKKQQKKKKQHHSLKCKRRK